MDKEIRKAIRKADIELSFHEWVTEICRSKSLPYETVTEVIRDKLLVSK
jgi:hypothetical protein